MKTEFVPPTTGWHALRAQIYTQLWFAWSKGGINRDDLARVFEMPGEEIRKLLLTMIDAEIVLPENREGMYQLVEYPSESLHARLFALLEESGEHA
jgi:hypothetical protein